MKPREPRRKIYVPARANVDQRWINVNVLDVSSRGFNLQTASAPPSGSYIELHRGNRSFIARVVWTSEQRFGVRTQDAVTAEAFVNPAAADPQAKPDADGTAQVERRTRARREEGLTQRLERSRTRAKAMEYGWVVAFGAIGAMIVIAMIQQSLGRPLAQLASALN